LELEEWTNNSLFYDPVILRDRAEISAVFTSIHTLDLFLNLAQFMKVTTGKLFFALLNTQRWRRTSAGKPWRTRECKTLLNSRLWNGNVMPHLQGRNYPKVMGISYHST